jgi:hypothetical protein
LISSVSARDDPAAALEVEELLDRTEAGYWRGSAELLVPAKAALSPSLAPGAHEDSRGLVTTAIASYALRRASDSGFISL